MKKRIKLTESNLRMIVSEAVKKTLKKLNEDSEGAKLRAGQKLSNEDLIDMIKNPEKYKTRTSWGALFPAEFRIYNNPEDVMYSFILSCEPDKIERNMKEFQEFLAGRHERSLKMRLSSKKDQQIDYSQLPEPTRTSRDEGNDINYKIFVFTADDVAYWKVRTLCGLDQISLDPVFKDDYINKVWSFVSNDSYKFAKYFFDKYGAD